MRPAFLWLLWSLGQASLVLAQHPAADEAGSLATVSGHVYCADTNAPARMATITLQPADAMDAYRPEEQNGVPSNAEAVQTLLDGSFSIPHVAPGAYYVIATEPGYLSPLASFSAPVGDPPAADAAARKLSKSVPRITVQGNLPVSVNVTLERGAAVSGTVLFDDGSPASGLNVQLLVRSNDQWTAFPSSPFDRSVKFAQTDDLGSYRISGLPGQDYAIQVDLNLSKWTYSFDGHGGSGASSSGVYSISFYSGNKMRPKDAASFAVKQGEERHGEDIQIPLSKLHVINGGEIRLLYPDDKSEAANASNDDGGFTFSFVPAGDYILQAASAADLEYVETANPPNSSPPTRTESHPLHNYGPAELTLHIDGDLSGVTIAVPELPEQKSPPSP
jgi:hypothetical protein